MNPSRAQAYGRVIRTIEEIGPAKLLPSEQELLREIADALLFSGEEPGEATVSVNQQIDDLAEHLVSSGRWTRERADELRADLYACGPAAPAEQLPRAA